MFTVIAFSITLIFQNFGQSDPFPQADRQNPPETIGGPKKLWPGMGVHSLADRRCKLLADRKDARAGV